MNDEGDEWVRKSTDASQQGRNEMSTFIKEIAEEYKIHENNFTAEKTDSTNSKNKGTFSERKINEGILEMQKVNQFSVKKEKPKDVKNSLKPFMNHLNTMSWKEKRSSMRMS